jgi:hypothetical protein
MAKMTKECVCCGWEWIKTIWVYVATTVGWMETKDNVAVQTRTVSTTKNGKTVTRNETRTIVRPRKPVKFDVWGDKIPEESDENEGGWN